MKTKKAAPAKAKKPVAAKKAAAPKKKATAAAPAKKAVAPAKAKPAAPSGLADQIVALLDKDKAQNIVTIQLKGKTAIADAMIIATGTSSRHVVAMAQNLRDKLKATLKLSAQLEGVEVGDWVIVDAHDVIVHLFRDEVRRTYNLEKLWGSDFATVHYTLYQ